MSKARDGINAALAAHPDADVLRLGSLVPAGENVAVPSPWITIDLREPDGRLVRLAVWRETGHAYRVGEDGAVADDPFWYHPESWQP